jgi:hypothetical protein
MHVRVHVAWWDVVNSRRSDVSCSCCCWQRRSCCRHKGWVGSERSVAVLRDRPAVCYTPAVVGDAIVRQRGGGCRDSSVSTTTPGHPARRHVAAGASPSHTPTRFSPEGCRNAWDAPVSLCDVHCTTRLVESLELVAAAVPAERSREKVTQRPRVLVRMHVPGVVPDVVLPPTPTRIG